MKTDFKGWYVVYDPKGNPILRTLHFIRKECIAEFLEPFNNVDWREATKAGWKCVKINFIINPIV